MLSVALRVALVAISLALDVFAVSVGVGVRGVPRGTKLRIGLSFAAAEIGMNLIGAALGTVLGKLIGGVAAYLGYSALIAVGIYMLVETGRPDQPSFDLSRGWGLFIAALSLSLDSLGIGFSIVYIGVPLPITLAAIGFASVTSTALGLTFGRMIGERAERQAALVAGMLLIATGLTFALFNLTGHE